MTRRASSSPAGDRDRPRPRLRPPRPPRPRPRSRCGRLAPTFSPRPSRRAGATVAALASLSAPETSEGSGRDGSDVPSRVTRRLLRTRVTGARGPSSGPDVDARHRTHRALVPTAAAGHAPRSIARRSESSACSVGLPVLLDQSTRKFRGPGLKSCARPPTAPFHRGTAMEDLPTVRTSLDGGDVTPPGTPRSKEPPATPTTPSIGTRETRSAVEFHRAFHRGSAEGSARVPESSAAATRGAAPRSRFARLRGALHVTEAHRTRPREHPEPRLTAPLVVTWLPGCALAVIRLVVHLICHRHPRQAAR